MIEDDVQFLGVGTPVELYTIDLTPLGGSILYLTPHSTGGGNGLRFGGKVFAPVDIQGDGFDVSGKGTLPRPTVRVTALAPQIPALVNSLGDCVGGIVTRTRTFSKYLDGASDADPTEKYPDDVFYIQQMTASNKLFIEWQLSSVIDLQNRQVPRRKISRKYCSHVYRKTVQVGAEAVFDYTQATCPYAGANMFDQFNQPTTDKTKDRCSKYLSGCRARFGRQALPARFFPGAGRFTG